MSKRQKLILILLAAIALMLGLLTFAAKVNDTNVVPVVTPTPEPTPEIEVIELVVCTPESESTPIPNILIQPTAESPEEPAVSPAPDLDSKSTTAKNGTAFTLTIDGSNISVGYGVDEVMLETTPGWLMTSAEPGEEGVCVVYGHRNRKHLKALEDVDFGDTITVTMSDGTSYAYRIESIEILESEADLKIPTLDGQHIMLTTCYPFHYTGHAPKKYVVIAGR